MYSFGLMVVMVACGAGSAAEAKQLVSNFSRLDLSIEQAEDLLQQRCGPGAKPV